MNKEDSNLQNETNVCMLVYKTVLTAVLLLPMIMYAIYLPMRDSPLLLWGVPLCTITIFIVMSTRKSLCEKEKNIGN